MNGDHLLTAHVAPNVNGAAAGEGHDGAPAGAFHAGQAEQVAADGDGAQGDGAGGEGARGGGDKRGARGGEVRPRKEPGQGGDKGKREPREGGGGGGGGGRGGSGSRGGQGRARGGGNQ